MGEFIFVFINLTFLSWHELFISVRCSSFKMLGGMME